MNSKKYGKEQQSQSIVILPHELNWREVRAILKRRHQEAKINVIEEKLPAVLEFAGKSFGREFKTLKAFVSFVSKKVGKSGKRKKRTPALSSEQIETAKKMKSDGSTHQEIAKELGTSLSRINGIFYGKKK
jgi:hypothetical protein